MTVRYQTEHARVGADIQEYERPVISRDGICNEGSVTLDAEPVREILRIVAQIRPVDGFRERKSAICQQASV
jgi:hypothetical protein